jgi:hypothetical protein
MATTTTLERLRDAVDDLRHTLSVIEYGLDALEAANSDSHNCECGHPRKWHKSLTHHHQCQTPDCPCRKFEPAGGDA